MHEIGEKENYKQFLKSGNLMLYSCRRAKNGSNIFNVNSIFAAARKKVHIEIALTFPGEYANLHRSNSKVGRVK